MQHSSQFLKFCFSAEQRNFFALQFGSALLFFLNYSWITTKHRIPFGTILYIYALFLDLLDCLYRFIHYVRRGRTMAFKRSAVWLRFFLSAKNPQKYEVSEGLCKWKPTAGMTNFFVFIGSSGWAEQFSFFSSELLWRVFAFLSRLYIANISRIAFPEISNSFPFFGFYFSSSSASVVSGYYPPNYQHTEKTKLFIDFLSLSMI